LQIVDFNEPRFSVLLVIFSNSSQFFSLALSFDRIDKIKMVDLEFVKKYGTKFSMLLS